LTADSEFFTRESCYMPLSKGIVVEIRSSKSAKKSLELRECKDRFNIKQYKARKKRRKRSENLRRNSDILC